MLRIPYCRSPFPAPNNARTTRTNRHEFKPDLACSILQLLLSGGLSVTQLTKEFETGLHVLVKTGALSLVEVVKRHDDGFARVLNQPNLHGQTPIMVAVGASAVSPPPPLPPPP